MTGELAAGAALRDKFFDQALQQDHSLGVVAFGSQTLVVPVEMADEKTVAPKKQFQMKGPEEKLDLPVVAAEDIGSIVVEFDRADCQQKPEA